MFSSVGSAGVCCVIKPSLERRQNITALSTASVLYSSESVNVCDYVKTADGFQSNKNNKLVVLQYLHKD